MFPVLFCSSAFLRCSPGRLGIFHKKHCRFRICEENYEGKDNWQFVSFPGLSHMFTEGKYEEGPASYQGAKHIPDKVTETIAGFINE